VIRLVSDSGSQVTPALRRQFGVDVVPLTVVVDGIPHLEGLSIDTAGITAALRRGAALSTSTPSPGEFLQAYQRALDGGATEVLSIHTGGAVSGTATAARLAAEMAPLPVQVLDTGTASFPVTLCLWAAADILADGGTIEHAAAAARQVASSTGNVFVVGTLDLARRGGRVAPGVEGTPVLALIDGQMCAVAEVSGSESAVDAMADYVARHASGQRLRIGVGHLAATELAEHLTDAVRCRVQIEKLVRYEVGPSIAVHTGLGTVGCVFHPI